MIKVSFSVICLFCFLTVHGQNSLCECCLESSFQWTDKFERLIDPRIIKNNRIHELTIYRTAKTYTTSNNDTTFTTVNPEYKEMSLIFNDSGYVVERTIFNAYGEYHSIYEYTRGFSNEILTKAFYYLDTSGLKEKNSFVTKTIYKYSEGKLIKIKDLDNKLLEQADSKSTFTKYIYDKNGVIAKEVMQTPYGKSNYRMVRKYRFKEDLSYSISEMQQNGRYFSTIDIKYNTNSQPLKEFNFDKKNDKTLNEKIYKYNAKNQIVKFQNINSYVYNECRGGGNYTDYYFYSSLGLISRINHTFQDVVCELRFEYR